MELGCLCLELFGIGIELLLNLDIKASFNLSGDMSPTADPIITINTIRAMLLS